jgi:hypothetical protein
MPRTVITIPGFGATYDTNNFGGAPFAAPNVRVASPSGGWSSWITNSSAESDMNALYNLIIEHINAQADGLLVMGHSRGGQIIYKLFRQRMTDLVANVNPSKVLFVSSGNPERKWGGGAVNNWEDKKPIYPGDQPYGNGYGLPLAGIAPFTMVDINRQYDEWADYPNDFNNAAAITAINSSNVHSAYDGAPALGADGYPVNWNDWAVHTEGTITYLTAPAQSSVTAAPLTFSQRIHGGAYTGNRVLDARQNALIAAAPIENAYIRPVPVYPKVNVP